MQTPAISSSSAWMRGVVKMFSSQGLDPEALFHDAQLDISRLDQSHERFSAAEVGRLWRSALKASGQVNLGLDRQLVSRYINFDYAIQAMWPGPNLRGGAESLSRYLQLTGDFAAFTVQPQLGGAWLALAHGTEPETPRQRVEYGLLVLLTLCRRVTRHPLRPLAAEFAYPEPADYHPYRMAFGCPLRFDQAATRVLLSDEDLALPLTTSGESLFALHDQLIEQRLARMGKARYSFRTSEQVMRKLHLGEPRLRNVARDLGLADEALQQKLRAEGTSFERVLEDVRRELAGHYLMEPGYAIARLPAMLGYPSHAPFAAACKRWFGTTAAAWRQLQQADRVTS
jgi:AraC-like DNA-binding protein